MAKQATAKSTVETPSRRVEKSVGGRPHELRASAPLRSKSCALLDTRVIYCGDNLDQLKKLPDDCVDLIYIDPPFSFNRNYGPCRTGHRWGETKEQRRFDDRHESTKACIDYPP